MREESRFRPDALSPAQAMGLMQIIPPTGVAIARELGRKGFVPEQLYRPVVNIEYGVQYLNTNLKRFGGALPQTIASYNAGPDAVARWLKARPDREWDEFIEEIPYQETNRYVKKVLKSYYIYCLLYSPLP
jgi:soluble lytic murein transglycosylase